MVAVDSSSDDDVPLGQKFQVVGSKNGVEMKDGRAKSPKAGSGQRLESQAPNLKQKRKAAPSTVAKPKSKKVVPGKNKSPSKEKSAETTRTKRVFEKPGQTRPEPEEDDPLRKFYTSLLEQVPESEMAKRWCVMSGLLSIEEATAWVAKNGKKKSTSSPQKKSSSRKTGSKVKAVRTGKHKSVSVKKLKDAKKSKAKARPAKVKIISEDELSSDSEVMPSKGSRRQKSDAPKASNAGRNKKDVAFFDGGLDESDSDDDIPLAQMMAK
eukprot:jgi/Picsp_1/6249/NSC_03603-R1_protein